MPYTVSNPESLRRTHDCPGDCGRSVEWSRFSCAPCWDRLPVVLRNAIKRTFGSRNLGDSRVGRAAHANAMLAGHRWYRDNPAWDDSAPKQEPVSARPLLKLGRDEL